MLLSPLWLAVTFLHAAAGCDKISTSVSRGGIEVRLRAAQFPGEGGAAEGTKVWRRRRRKPSAKAGSALDREVHAHALYTCVCRGEEAHIVDSGRWVGRWAS